MSLKYRPLRVVALITLCALAAAAPLVYGHLPVTRHDGFATPAPEFSGVVTVAVASSFLPSKGGFVPFALKCARDAERKHPGLLVRVEDISIRQLQRRLETGENLPDVVLTGGGVIADPQSIFMPLEDVGGAAGAAYLEACSVDGVRYGAPIAAGAYGLLVNTDWMDRAQVSPETPFEQLIPALKAKSIYKKGGFALQCPLTTYGLPAAALSQITGALPAGLDGLPGDLGLADPASAWPDFALEQRYAMYLCTQREAERLRILRAGGKGPSAHMVAVEYGAWTDQVLYGAILLNEQADSGLLTAARRVLEAMCSDAAQPRLQAVGAFSVTDGVTLYADGAQQAMRTLELSLRGAVVQNVFDRAAREHAADAMRALSDPANVPSEVYRIVFSGIY